jgi:hypothetical protein
MRFSLGTLLLVVAFVGLGSAAFARPSQLWVEAMVTLTVSFLFAASVAAIVGAGRTRIFAAGFAIVGWLYFLLTFGGFADVKQSLLTTRSIAWVNAWRQQPEGESYKDLALYTFDSAATSNRPVELNSFVFRGQSLMAIKANLGRPASIQPAALSIGHALWTILLAVLGGAFAQVVHKRTTPNPSRAPIGVP